MAYGYGVWSGWRERRTEAPRNGPRAFTRKGKVKRGK